MANDYALSRMARIYATAESSFKTGVIYTAGSFVAHKGGAKLDWTRTRTPVVERKDTVGVSEQVLDQPDSMAFSLPQSYLKPYGSLAAAPDAGVFLKAVTGSESSGNSSDTVQASPSPTTTSFGVGTVGNFSVGQPIRMTGGNTSGEVTFVKSISGSTLTVEPALSQAPAASDGLVTGYGYRGVSDNEESLTIYHDIDNQIHGASGVILNSLGIEVARDGTLMFNVDGIGAGTRTSFGKTTLGSGIDASVTSMDIADGDSIHYDSNVPLWLTIEAEGANSAEVVAVTAATSGGTLTITRNADGGGASAHSAGAVVTPWRPSVTNSGSPLAGLTGSFKLAGSAFSIHSFKFSLNEGKELRESNFGESTANGPFRNGDNARKVSIELAGKFEKDVFKKFTRAWDGDSLTAFIQVGTTAGAIFAMYFPKFQPEFRNVDEGSGQVVFDYGGACFETSGNDEFYMGFV